MLNHYQAFPFRAQAPMENRRKHCNTQPHQTPWRIERGRDMKTLPSSFALDRHDAPPGDRDIARLLAHRYGDGTVYLPSGTSTALYRSSIARGFVSAEGFITTQGRRLLASYS